MSVLPDSQRFESLDALKCLCMLLIIPLHYPFFPPIADHYPYIARFAVPVFFVITGFFFEMKWPHVSAKKQAVKLLRLLLAGSVLYIITQAVTLTAAGESLRSMFPSIIGHNGIAAYLRDVFLFNCHPVPWAFHLWYLQALLYAWLIVFAIRRILGNIGRNLLYLSIPFLLFGAATFSNYSTLIIGYIFRTEETRNFLFCGIPYIALGSMIFTFREPLCRAFSKRVLFLLFILFCLLARTEEYLLSSLRRGPTHDYYFSTPFQAASFFLLFLQFSRCPSASLFIRPLAYIGRRYASTVYIIHLAAAPLILQLLSALHLSGFFSRINGIPIAIFLGSVASSAALSAAGALLRRCFSSRNK